jgi:hypothetical protein
LFSISLLVARLFIVAEAFSRPRYNRGLSLLTQGEEYCPKGKILDEAETPPNRVAFLFPWRSIKDAVFDRPTG